METTFREKIRRVAGKNPYSWAKDRGINKPTMTSLLHATRPQRKSLFMLEEKTGIPVDWWLNGEGPPPGLTKYDATPKPGAALHDAPALSPTKPVPEKINALALTAILTGILRTAPQASPEAIAALAAKIYNETLDAGLITATGLGDGHLDAAA